MIGGSFFDNFECLLDPGLGGCEGFEDGGDEVVEGSRSEGVHEEEGFKDDGVTDGMVFGFEGEDADDELDGLG